MLNWKISRGIFVKKENQNDGLSVIPTILMFGFLGEYISGELRTSDESIEVV